MFGRSKFSSATSNYSGNNSNISMGGGIASRFSLALSKIIDPTVESNTTGNTGSLEDNDEIV